MRVVRKKNPSHSNLVEEAVTQQFEGSMGDNEKMT